MIVEAQNKLYLIKKKCNLFCGGSSSFVSLVFEQDNFFGVDEIPILNLIEIVLN